MNETPPPPTTAAYYGWRRLPRHRWERIEASGAATSFQCWGKLLSFDLPGDKMVLPAHDDPNRKNTR